MKKTRKKSNSASHICPVIPQPTSSIRHYSAAIYRRRPLAAIFQLTFTNKHLQVNIYSLNSYIS